MRVYAWVKQSDDTFFRKMKKYLEISSVDEVVEDRFIDAPIEVGTLIECVGGVNFGMKGRVRDITRCYYRFESQVEGQIKLKLVFKKYAKSIVDWEKEKASVNVGDDANTVPKLVGTVVKDIPTTGDFNKKRKSDPRLFNLVI